MIKGGTRMSENTKTRIKELIVLFLMFGFKYLPAFGQVTPFGMAILGIFIGIIFGWLTLGFMMPSLCALLALAFSGAYENIGACFAASFGSSTIPMVIGCLFMMALMNILDLAEVIVGFLMNIKWIRKNMTVFFMFFFTASWITAIFSGFTFSIPLFVGIYSEMSKQAKIPQGSKVNSFVVCGLAFAGMLGNMSMPFKAVSVTIMGMLESFTGVTLSFVDYLLYISSFQVAAFIVYALVGRFVLRIDYKVFTAVSVPKVKPTARQAAGLACMAVMMAGFILSTFPVPVFSYLGLGGVGILTIIVMILITVDGKPLVKINEIAARFDWPMLFLMVVFTPFVSFVGSADAGITETIRIWVSPVLSVMPPILVVFLSIVGSVMVSNVLNNLPVAIIFISVMNVLTQSMTGIHAPAAIIAVVLASYLAYAMPSANPGTAMVFRYTDLIDPKVTIKTAFISSIFMALFTALVYYPLLSLVL